MATNKSIAQEYVAEYLSRRPDFADVVEYVDMEYPYSDEEDIVYGEIWTKVLDALDDVEVQYATGDN